jgi:hypothetical protein
MAQRGYVQSCASIRQRGEPILPPVMPAPMAMECQILAAMDVFLPGVEIPNWGVALAAVVVILLLYSYMR